MIASTSSGMSASMAVRQTVRVWSSALPSSSAGKPRFLSQQTSKPKSQPTIKRGTLRKKIEHENKLRHAINLYHASHNFLPSIATRAGQERIDMVLDETNKQREQLPVWARDEGEQTVESDGQTSASDERLASHDEQLDWFIRSQLTDSLRAANGDRQKRGLNMRTANMTLDYVHNSRLRSAANNADDHDAELARQGRVDHLFNYNNRSSSSADKLPSLPARDDPAAIKAYLAEATQRTADVMRQSVGVDEGIVRSDNRTARVRDALFGTVRGNLPGLEVVRERARDARVRREAERLAQEQHDRRAGLS